MKSNLPINLFVAISSYYYFYKSIKFQIFPLFKIPLKYLIYVIYLKHLFTAFYFNMLFIISLE